MERSLEVSSSIAICVSLFHTAGMIAIVPVIGPSAVVDITVNSASVLNPMMHPRRPGRQGLPPLTPRSPHRPPRSRRCCARRDRCRSRCAPPAFEPAGTAISRTPVAGSTLVASQRDVRAKAASLALPIAAPCRASRTRPRGRPHRDTDWPEAQRIDRPAQDALELAHAGKIDDVHALGGHVREAVARARSTMCGAPAQLRLHVGGDELLDHLPAERRAQWPRATCLPSRKMVSVSVASSNRVAQRGQPLVAHQHQEVDLRQVRRCSRIEAAGTVFDRIGAVEGQRLRRHEQHARSGLRRKPLTG